MQSSLERLKKQGKPRKPEKLRKQDLQKRPERLKRLPRLLNSQGSKKSVLQKKKHLLLNALRLKQRRLHRSLQLLRLRQKQSLLQLRRQ